jgi:acetyl esterase/lipase
MQYSTRKLLLLTLASVGFTMFPSWLRAQVPKSIGSMFPAGTSFSHNIPYADDTLKKHLLDIYHPPQIAAAPLVVWIHGGAWNHNDKYADMGYMKETVKGFLEKGYALASIDYRFSTTQAFPAQIRDCYQALEFLSKNAERYKIDRTRIALIGFSAGGHLASLLALSLNNNIREFHPSGAAPTFEIKAVIDFYGPADLLMMSATQDPGVKDDPIYQLLGGAAIERPDLARNASPVTYVDKNDPPFFIVHGEKDESVPYQQSLLLRSSLNLAAVKTELTIVKDAPHYGVMFDTIGIRTKLFNFLNAHLK